MTNVTTNYKHNPALRGELLRQAEMRIFDAWLAAMSDSDWPAARYQIRRLETVNAMICGLGRGKS